jgi:hypothetical protein
MRQGIGDRVTGTGNLNPESQPGLVLTGVIAVRATFRRNGSSTPDAV